jgi:hypothetical protein
MKGRCCVIGIDKLITLEDMTSVGSPLHILSKLERQEHIHVFRTCDDCVKFDLPRYHLGFQLSQGEIGEFKSLNFAGFHLASCQHLVDTLIGFDEYLILEHKTTSNLIVLIPRGNVESNGESRTAFVKRSEDVDANIEHFVYHVHPRFLNLRAPTISGRLQLAALYVAIKYVASRFTMCDDR